MRLLSTPLVPTSVFMTAEGMSGIKFVIRGEPASKANSRRLVMFGKKPAVIKSMKAVDYVASFMRQCPKLAEPMDGPVSVYVKIYYASRRPDLDETVILDAMQGYIYVNDRQVRERHAYWGLDPENPRAEIEVIQIPEPEGYAKAKPVKKRAGTGHQGLSGKRKGKG